MAFSRFVKNLREAAFILGCILLAYLLVALLTYHPDDPSGGKTSAAGATIRNWGGLFGAYWAFSLLEWFGYSAFFLSLIGALFLYSVLLQPSVYTALLQPAVYRSSVGWFWAGVGVLLFMLSSSSLEYLRYSTAGGLPGEAGGVVGKLLAESMAKYFGNFGASLLFAGIWILSWSLSANLSWFAFFESVGLLTEKFFGALFRGAKSAKEKRKQKRAAAAALPVVAAGAPAGVGLLSASPEVNDPTKKAPIFGALARKKKNKDKVKKESPLLDGDGGDDGDSKKSKSKKTKPADTVAPPLPELALLDVGSSGAEINQETLTEISALIVSGLKSFNIEVEVTKIHPGPVVTRYDLKPAEGVKGAQIVNLSRDLARSLSVSAIRVMETIPGTNYIGLEIPNPKRQMVGLLEILSSAQFQNSEVQLPLALGKTAAGDVAVHDLAAMPHLLVAGATGAGKSVFINSILLSLLYSKTPDDIRLLLIDPKMLELASYADIPHLLAPVVTDMQLAPAALNWAVNEMERRYRTMADAGVRNIASYNQAVADGKFADDDEAEALPYIVVVIDELADLMMVSGKKVELFINRLAQKARAAGIHLILATQRPSVDVITGLIKANVPCRISFQVASKIDSRTILDQMGAEALLGKGDMLFLSAGAPIPQRLHGAYISDSEISRVTENVRGSRDVAYLTDFISDGDSGGGGGTDFLSDDSDGESDPLYDEAVAVVTKTKRVSISLIQRQLRIGYNRAARLVEAMEKAKLVSPMNEYGARTLLTKE